MASAGLYPGDGSATWPASAGSAPRSPAQNAVIVGLRDVDRMEKPYVQESGIRAFTMRDIDERGLRAVMEDAMGMASDGTAGFMSRLT